MSNLPSLFQLSLTVSWSLVLVGFVTGALMGLFFHRTEWFGGYGSFRRRILRLGHIACFGLPILNTLLVLLFIALRVPPGPLTGGVWFWIAGQIAMPLVCFLSAWKEEARFAFFVPVTCLLLGTAGVFWELYRA